MDRNAGHCITSSTNSFPEAVEAQVPWPGLLSDAGGSSGNLPSARWSRMSSPPSPTLAISHCPGICLSLLGEAPTPARGTDGGWDRQRETELPPALPRAQGKKLGMSKDVGTGAALVSPPGSKVSTGVRWERPDPCAQDGCVGTAGPRQPPGRNLAARTVAGQAEEPVRGL